MSAGLHFYDPDDRTSGDMTVITDGRIDIYNKINSVRRQVAALYNVQTGIGPINSWTQIAGYWMEQPKIILSPKRLPSFFAKYKLCRQRYTMSATVSQKSDGIYQMYPTFTFYVDSTSGGASPGYTANGTPNPGTRDNMYYSGDLPIITAQSSPFYLSPGGTVAVNYSYRIASQQVLTTNCKVYLDYSRGNSYSSVLLSDNSYNTGDTSELTFGASANVGDGLCIFRIRMEVSVSAHGGTGTAYTDQRYYLRLNSYSYSFGQTSFAPTDGEVFYLAVGR